MTTDDWNSRHDAAQPHRQSPPAEASPPQSAPSPHPAISGGSAGFDGWITGRKRYQGAAREAVEFFEAEGDLRIKVNPLAHWGREDIEDYIVNNRLPRHPLVARGFASIGCAPCTSAVKPGEDSRAGRWRNSNKTECGIHFINGRAVPVQKENAA